MDPTPRQPLKIDLADADGGHDPSPERRSVTWGWGLDGVLHSIAYAPPGALGGNFLTTPWEDAATALQVSAYSLKSLTMACRPLFGPDGAAFSPTHTRKGDRLYRYYVSQMVLKHGAGSCPVGRLPAGEIEAAVIGQLRAVFRQPEIVAGTWKAARARSFSMIT